MAARLAACPHWLIGNSFEVPPQAEYFPPMNYWQAEHATQCATWDTLVLRHTNQALALLAASPLARLTDIFANAGRAILSIPELTHYPDAAKTAPVLGPSFVDDIGLAPRWPGGSGPKVFVYLAPTHDDFAPAIHALRTSGATVLVHAKGVSPARITQLSSPSMRIEAEPLHVAQTLKDADIVVSHAGIGLCSAAALAGKPQLVLPRHTEQSMVARRIADNGIGLQVPLGQKNTRFDAMLQQLLDDARFRTAAQKLAARHSDAKPALTAQLVTELIFPRG